MNMVRSILLAEYALLIAISPFIVLLYQQKVRGRWQDHARGDGYILALGICLAWSGEFLVRSWWFAWRILDEPLWMIAHPVIPLFIGLKCAGGILHAVAPLRSRGRPTQIALGGAIMAAWLGVVVAWFKFGVAL